jgi:hypothetical protein
MGVRYLILLMICEISLSKPGDSGMRSGFVLSSFCAVSCVLTGSWNCNCLRKRKLKVFASCCLSVRHWSLRTVNSYQRVIAYRLRVELDKVREEMRFGVWSNCWLIVIMGNTILIIILFRYLRDCLFVCACIAEGLVAQWSLYVPPGQHSTILRSAHTVYLCVLCGSENKQRLFPYTTLTDWFL